MVYNGYYNVMSNIPKMGQLPTPFDDFFLPLIHMVLALEFLQVTKALESVAIFATEWGTCDASGDGTLNLEEAAFFGDQTPAERVSSPAQVVKEPPFFRRSSPESAWKSASNWLGFPACSLKPIQFDPENLGTQIWGLAIDPSPHA